MTPATRRPDFALLAPACAALLLAPACERVTDLRVALVTTACEQDVALDPLNGVTQLRFSVYGEDLRSSDYSRTADVRAGEIQLPDVPAGKDRILVVEGLTGAAGVIVSLGTSGPLDLTQPDSPVDVTIFLRRTNAFSPSAAQDSPRTCTRMNASRAAHAAAVLDDGRVLIAGGLSIDGDPPSVRYLNSTEIYDPKSGRFTTGPNLAIARAYHTVTHIPGTTLTIIAGGRNDTDNGRDGLRLVEIFDESLPLNLGISGTAALAVPRSGHTATAALDRSARVVITGGYTQTPVAGEAGVVTGSVEVFDASTRTFTSGTSFEAGRAEAAHVAVGNNVYVVGGWDGARAIRSTVILVPRPAGVFDPQASGSLNLSVGRILPLAASIGSVVVAAGGYTEPDDENPLAFRKASNALDALDTATGNLVPVSGTLGARRAYGAAAALFDDTVLVGGGGSATENATTIHRSADLVVVSPSDGRITALATNGSMRVERERLVYTTMKDGAVLVTGGVGSNRRTLDTAELYQPAYSPTPSSPWK